MTTKITPEAVKERIVALESAGETSLKEQFYLEALRLLVAAMDSNPVAYIFKHPAGRLFWSLTDESNKGHDDVMPVYASPQPAPVVPAVIDDNLVEGLRLLQCMLDDYRERNYGHAQDWVRHIDQRFSEHSEAHGDDAYCILHRLLAGEGDNNSPVIPDCYVMVPDDLKEAAADLLATLDDYPEQLVPINRDSAVVRALRAAMPQAGNSPVIPDSCTWHCEEDINNWHSDCGYQFQFMEDGPEENGVKFCPKCGKSVAVSATEGTEE